MIVFSTKVNKKGKKLYDCASFKLKQHESVGDFVLMLS